MKLTLRAIPEFRIFLATISCKLLILHRRNNGTRIAYP